MSVNLDSELCLGRRAADNETMGATCRYNCSLRYPFILNPKTARAINLDFPRNMLPLVDEVIE
jgi:hypothetical protein